MNHPIFDKVQKIFDLEEGSALDAFNMAQQRFPELYADWKQLQDWERLGYLTNPRVQAGASDEQRLLVLETRIAALCALAGK